jgi:hypothetical protein
LPGNFFLRCRSAISTAHNIKIAEGLSPDQTKGKLSATNDIEAVLRKIEYWHQGSITAFKIMYRDAAGIWD